MNLKNKGFYILTGLFILALVGISFFGGPVPYIFLWLTVLIPVSCALYIFYVISSLRIYQKTDGRYMVSSTPTDFYITLNNEGIISFSSVRMVFYSSFSSVSGLDDSIVYELPPHSSVTRRTKLMCRYRGEYLVGVKEIIVKDFLGLFTVKYRIKEPLSVVVSPAKIRLSRLLGKDDIPSTDRDSLINRTEPDLPVREYVPGDDIRLLHHKASAVMQKPMVRERTGVEKNSIAIVMEAGRHGKKPEDYLPAEDRIIGSALALSLYYAERNISADVFYRTDRAEKESLLTRADYEKIYETMRSYVFRDGEDTLKLMDELYISGSLAGYRMLIFILYDTDAAVLDLISKMNVSRAPVRIYSAVPGIPESMPSSVDRPGNVICIGGDVPLENIL